MKDSWTGFFAEYKKRTSEEKQQKSDSVYCRDPYLFDFDQMKFTVSGQEIELSKTEQKLLRLRKAE